MLMKKIFKLLLETGKTFFTGKATKEQVVLLSACLVFALTFSIVFNALSSAFLSVMLVSISELIYCFVPMKDTTLWGYWLRVPDYKRFYNDAEYFILKPRHELVLKNYLYILLGIIIFAIIEIIFIVF